MSYMMRDEPLKESARQWKLFLKDHDYPGEAINGAAAKLDAMADDLKDALLEWDETGVIPDVEAEGISLRQLTEVFGFKVIAAIMMIDWLRREPDQAKFALSQPVAKLMITREEAGKMLEIDGQDSDETPSK